MRLGVIVCPRCNFVKGVDVSSKTTKCPRCGKMLSLKQLKVVYETDSQEKLRQMVGLMNAELDGKREKFTKILKEKTNRRHNK